MIAQRPVPRQNEIFVNTRRKLLKNKSKLFPFALFHTKTKVPDIPSAIVGNQK